MLSEWNILLYINYDYLKYLYPQCFYLSTFDRRDYQLRRALRSITLRNTPVTPSVTASCQSWLVKCICKNEENGTREQTRYDKVFA